jgi:hypothetical protein
LRDSSGYLVNNLGIRLCPDNDFTDTLGIDTRNIEIFKGCVKMTSNDSVVTVPAGSIYSITCRERVIPTQLGDPIRFDIFTIFTEKYWQDEVPQFLL